VAWSPDGTRIAGGSFHIKVWDAESGALLLMLTGHTSSVNSVAWSPDRTRIASGSFDRNVKVWDAESGELLRTPSRRVGGGAWVGCLPGRGRRTARASPPAPGTAPSRFGTRSPGPCCAP